MDGLNDHEINGKVLDGEIVDDWVMADFPHVMEHMGVDIFNGQGWEAFDRGERAPPRPVDR